MQCSDNKMQKLIYENLLGQICHHVMEILLIYEMVMKFVFFCFKLFWKLFCPTKNLNIKYMYLCRRITSKYFNCLSA